MAAWQPESGPATPRGASWWRVSRLSSCCARRTAAAAAVSGFDFSGATRIGSSPLRELDAAGRAWDSMLTALGWFETYVPKALVSRLLGEAAVGGLKTEEREVTVLFTDIAGFSR